MVVDPGRSRGPRGAQPVESARGLRCDAPRLRRHDAAHWHRPAPLARLHAVASIDIRRRLHSKSGERSRRSRPPAKPPSTTGSGSTLSELARGQRRAQELGVELVRQRISGGGTSCARTSPAANSISFEVDAEHPLGAGEVGGAERLAARRTDGCDRRRPRTIPGRAPRRRARRRCPSAVASTTTRSSSPRCSFGSRSTTMLPSTSQSAGPESPSTARPRPAGSG